MRKPTKPKASKKPRPEEFNSYKIRIYLKTDAQYSQFKDYEPDDFYEGFDSDKAVSDK